VDWVKLRAGFYRDVAVATLDDAAEVMLNRGSAYCGDAETGGFIPDAILPSLTRKPAQAGRIASRIVTAGRWARVDGGYRIVDWSDDQAELEALIARRRTDRERQRRHRESREPARDMSRDSHVTVTGQRVRERTAAAAADAGDPQPSPSTGELPPAVDVLRAKMTAYTALAALRWDTLTPDQLTQVGRLIETQGDTRLIDTALRTCRTPPPVHVSAFLGTWAALPPRGERLHVVAERTRLPKSDPDVAAAGVAAARRQLSGGQL